MTAQTPAILKTYFETGDRPTQAQFADLIDSSVNVATTSAQVIKANVIVSGSFTPNHTLGIVGTTTNDSGAAGSVGEYISATTSGVSVNTGPSGQFGNILSINLTAGDWDTTGVVAPFANGSTITSNTMDYMLSLFSGNTTTDLVIGDNYGGVSNDTKASGSIPSWRVSVAAPTTVYLKGRVSYSIGTPQWQGRISARRIR